LGGNVPDKPNTATNCEFGYEGPISLNLRIYCRTEFNVLLLKGITRTNYFEIIQTSSRSVQPFLHK